jgi:C-terminal processing protease CtpA/Prc
MRSAVVRLGIVLLLAQISALAAEGPDPMKDEVITREQRAFGLVTIYANARQHFPYFDQLPNLDWDKAFMEYLPQVEKPQSLYDYYRVLRRFTALLEDGHTSVYSPPSVQPNLGRLPLRFEIIEGQWVITERIPNKEVLAEDIPPGTVLESIEGMPPGKYYAEKFFPYIGNPREQIKVRDLDGYATYVKDTKVKVVLRYPNGSSRERVLTANRTTQWTDELRAKYTCPWREGPGFSSSEPEPGILYMAFRSCDQESEKKAVELLESRKSDWPKGVILDLRANPGGNSPIDLFSHLIAKPAKWDDGTTRWSLSYMEAQTRGKSEADRAAWLKQRRFPSQFEPGWCPLSIATEDISPANIHYDGPLVVLTGPSTGSAAEHLVVLLQQAGRGTVMGDYTAGSSGQPVMFDLPGGGTGRVIATRSRYIDGREFTDCGCKPDVRVLPTIKGITQGRDEALEAALAYIKSSAK